jgi:hypothetical protein
MMLQLAGCPSLDSSNPISMPEKLRCVFSLWAAAVAPLLTASKLDALQVSCLLMLATINHLTTYCKYTASIDAPSLYQYCVDE